MRKIGALVLLFIVTLPGCSGASKEIQRAMDLRALLLRAASVTFDADVTADYGDKLYTFSLSCVSDERGDVGFTVTAPETISGITGHISRESGKLTFDDTALQFDTLADGQVTPVTAPWIFLRTLRGGCLTAAGVEGEQLRLTIDDRYEDDALQTDIWLSSDDIPLRCEILYGGRRILTLSVSNFQIS